MQPFPWMARRLTEGVEIGVTGDENYGLNFYEESGDTPPSLPTYVGINLPSDNALYGEYSFG